MTKAALACLTLFLAAGLAQQSAAQSGSRGGFTNQQLSRFSRQASGANFTSQAFVRQAYSQGVDLRGGFGAGRNISRNFNSGAAGFGGGRSRPSSRPFSNISRRPSLSPYLGLFQEGFDENENALAYQTIVRPQLRQQRFNNQVRRQAAQMEARLQSIAAGSGFNAQGNQQLAPTGVSPGAYRFLSHYYPTAR